MTTFSMLCPVCDDEIVDVEGTYTVAYGREEFWGAPVFLDESEFDVETIPACERCGKVTVTVDAAENWFWEREAM